jgi:hypothetical protein
MTTIRTICLLIFCMALNYNLKAQQPMVNFAYDGAGNRTARYISVIKATEVDSLSLKARIGLATSELQVNVFPNPTYGIINIEINRTESIPIDYVLFDQQAKLIMKGQLINNTETINLIHLETGVYYFRLNNTEKELVFKIIKQ